MDQSEGAAAIEVGLALAIIRVFNSLHDNGVLRLKDGSALLRSTAAALPDETHPAARDALWVIAEALGETDPVGVGAIEPKRPDWPSLFAIPAGRA